MKKIALLLILCLFATVCRAEHASNVILNLQDTPVAAEQKIIGFEERVEKIIEAAQYYDKQYPGNALYEDFSDDVAAHFPGLTRQEIYDYEDYIRKGISVYRFIADTYQKYKEKLLVPPNPPLILDDKEYDLFSPRTEYIDSDGTVIVEDFKKVISYSANPKDAQSYKAKLAFDAKHGRNNSAMDEFYYIANAIDWRDILHYDIDVPSPITGTRGIGKWQGSADKLLARLITIDTAVEKQERITGAVHFLIAPGYYVAATGNSIGQAPDIKFEDIRNLRNLNYTFPAPTRLLTKKIWEDRAIYAHEFAIPFSAEIVNPAEGAALRADITLSLCNKDNRCEEIRLAPTLELNKGRNRSSSVTAFIRQLHRFAPSDNLPELEISNFSIEEIDGHGQILKIVLDSDEKISYFDLFTNSADGIKMQRPRITIEGKEITVRVLPENKNQKIAGQPFEIIANLNGETFLRTTRTAELSPAGLAGKKHFSAMLFLAFLGGFILNFMPCVFPVLSLKLFSLTRFGARRPAEIRRSFGYTLLGIFCSFALLATGLSLLKYIGVSIGWGMQFQSPAFLVLMSLAIILFLLQAGGAIEIKLPQAWQKTACGNSDNLLHFLTGTLVVLMATPCTAPYLATAVGFALSGTIVDIFAIMSAIALGLALPYILLFVFPFLIVFLPTPGPWMQKLQAFMVLMLVLTLLWLTSILWTQTNGWFIVRFAFYGLLFAGLCWLIHYNRIMDEDSGEAPRSPRIIQKTGHIFFGLALAIGILALADGRFAGIRHLHQVQLSTVSGIQKQEIEHLVKEGKTVLVSVGADWCLTCGYNDVMVFKNPAFVRNTKEKQVELIKVDWTDYDANTLKFMEQYGRSGLPFYILFSPLIPDGMVLPEILNEADITRVINNITLSPPQS